MNKIAVFDVSGAVYYGTLGFSKTNDDYYGFPIAGMRALMSRSAIELAAGRKIAFAFDTRSVKKNWYEGYKANRTPNRNVSAQIEFLFEFLMKIGLPCVKVDGFEADDVISWYAEDYSDEDLLIYSNDHDVAHNVHDSIRMKPFKTSDVIICQSNYHTVLTYKFRSHIWPIEFNTINAYKVFCGCSSDGIPKFRSSLGFITETIYQRYVRFLRENNLIGNYQATSSFKVLAVFLNTVCMNEKLITESEKQELFRRIRIIYPLSRSQDTKMRVAGIDELDMNLMSQLLVACKDYHSLECLRCKKVDMSEQLLSVLRGYAKDLRNGAYSVDRNLEVDPSYEIDSEPMYLKEF